jgi:CheY-like chemotaxis protein
MAAKHILVLEDEFLIALDIAGVIEDGGFVVVGPFSGTAEALQALQQQRVDGALLDANLGGQPVGQFADTLAAMRVPFAFVSGYGRERLPPQHQSAPLVRKPFTSADLLAVIARF